MKTYILQKDLPDVKSGAEFKLSSDGATYFLSPINNKNKLTKFYNCYAYPKAFIENNTDWFKEKEEPPITLFEIRGYTNKQIFIITANYENLDYSEKIAVLKRLRQWISEEFTTML